jgi:intergrase/recombinase
MLIASLNRIIKKETGSGIQPEVVDMLQGRVSQSILTRHYLVPKPSFKEEVLQALEKLKRQV